MSYKQIHVNEIYFHFHFLKIYILFFFSSISISNEVYRNSETVFPSTGSQ